MLVFSLLLLPGITSCSKETALQRTFKTIDLKALLKEIYPFENWTSVVSELNTDNKNKPKIEFIIDCSAVFLTEHPDVKEILQMQLERKYPALKDIPLIFEFLPAALPAAEEPPAEQQSTEESTETNV